MKTYTKGLKKIIVNAIVEQNIPIEKIIEKYNISQSTIYSWIKAYQEDKTCYDSKDSSFHTLLVKEEGKTTKIDKVAPSLINHNERTHLCWNCKYGWMDCSKVDHVKKRTIDKYPYISEGMQEYDEEGNIVEFDVYECEMFNMTKKEFEQTESYKMLKKTTLQ